MRQKYGVFRSADCEIAHAKAPTSHSNTFSACRCDPYPHHKKQFPLHPAPFCITLQRSSAIRLVAFSLTVGPEPLHATIDGWRSPETQTAGYTFSNTEHGHGSASLTLVLSRPLVMTGRGTLDSSSTNKLRYASSGNNKFFPIRWSPAIWTPGSRRLYPNRPLAAGHLPKDLLATCISVAQPKDRPSSD
ncbi:uncharacterized protein CLUP02_13920 [Colletotrichum lupini]|uniref:Uncharacterized protein n=1 Tax=Colletotrichum lupini TaxID=145971 RepID=A0A9Q8T390_9PEZI|nr:uncharacterized protein CLUP02_13920 [Colletotrichum lupini]UQC88396.1 hypothetical protein CLUP02_13920 [Colletotrichum lupini]